jgi:hypothetical protein
MWLILWLVHDSSHPFIEQWSTFGPTHYARTERSGRTKLVDSHSLANSFNISYRMLQTSSHADVIRSLDTIDDSPDEDMAEFEHRITVSRSQESRRNDTTRLEAALGGRRVDQPCDFTEGRVQTPVPKQQDFRDPKYSKNQVKSPALRDQRDMANSRSFPAKHPMDSSVRKAEIKERRFEIEEETQSGTVKRRPDLAVTLKDHSGAASKPGASAQETIKEVIDVDALSDQDGDRSNRECASSGSSRTAIALPVDGRKGPPQSSLGKNLSAQHPSKGPGIISASNPVESAKKTVPALVPKPKKLTQKDLDRIKKERKNRESKMTHRQYIETLPEKYYDREVTHSQYFAGAVILFVAAMTEMKEATREKLSLVRLKLFYKKSYMKGTFTALSTRSYYIVHLRRGPFDPHNYGRVVL